MWVFGGDGRRRDLRGRMHERERRKRGDRGQKDQGGSLKGLIKGSRFRGERVTPKEVRIDDAGWFYHGRCKGTVFLYLGPLGQPS